MKKENLILEVPLIKQPEDSKDCGIVGIQMLLKYYGIDLDLQELKKEIEIDNTGTYAPQLGLYLINKGFAVEIVSLHPSLFTKKDENLSQDKILERFNQLYKNSQSQQNKKILKHFINFMKANGKIKVKIPDKEEIIEEIKNQRPIGALMTSNFLTSKKPGFNFHFNLINGIDDEFIYANDPLPDERGGKNKYLIKDFFYGLYCSAYGDMDNACLIKVRNNYK